MTTNLGPTLGNGKICYVEIPALDIERSSKFYHHVFGWKLRTRGDGAIAFDDGINEVSGTWVLGRKPHTEQGLILSIMVDSVAETTTRIVAQKCKMVKDRSTETEVIAWFSDPAGNIIGLYQHPGGGDGKICYLEIPTDDTSRSARFYKAVFNWPVREDNNGNAAFDDGVGVVSGMWETGFTPSIEPGLMIYVMMDDVAATTETIKAAGGQIVQPIGADAPEITARFADPFGNVLGLYQPPKRA